MPDIKIYPWLEQFVTISLLFYPTQCKQCECNVAFLSILPFENVPFDNMELHKFVQNKTQIFLFVNLTVKTCLYTLFIVQPQVFLTLGC